MRHINSSFTPQPYSVINLPPKGYFLRRFK